MFVSFIILSLNHVETVVLQSLCLKQVHVFMFKLDCSVFSLFQSVVCLGGGACLSTASDWSALLRASSDWTLLFIALCMIQVNR